MTATTPLINEPRRTEEEYRAGVPREECAEALASRLVTVSLTMDELTCLLYVLEAAKDRTSLDAMFARQPTYPPRHPETQQEYEAVAQAHALAVADLCDRITDIWKENR